MLRQTMITLVTAAALSGVLAADAFALAAGGFGGGAHIGGGFGGGAHMGGAFGGGAHVGGGFGRGHFGGAMGGGRIGGGLRAGHFGGGRFAGRFEPSHRVRGLVVPFGYYDDWYSGYGYYDPSTVTPEEPPTYPTAAYPYVKPPRSSCSTQTYKVPSENGGEASVNVVRC
jgi:hypothetical protein